jgi:hypothetical protein
MALAHTRIHLTSIYLHMFHRIIHLLTALPMQPSDDVDTSTYPAEAKRGVRLSNTAPPCTGLQLTELESRGVAAISMAC